MTQSRINRQWRLRARPEGRLRTSDLERTEHPWDDPELQDGQVRIRNLLFLCAPTMRNWMKPPEGPCPSIPLGAPVRASAAGRVVESRHSGYPVGSRLTAMSSWQDYAVIDVEKAGAQQISDGVSAVEALGVLGVNSLTAYFGLLRIGRPQPGETLVVSGAAGSTGSVAAQIGKLQGCRVVGIAGGDKKCEWLRQECRVDAVVNYRSENMQERLEALCPTGIDVFYDNVGGAILEAAVRNMARFGRIVLCGQISEYNTGSSGQGLSDTMRLVYGSLRVQGFLFTDFKAEFPEAVRDLKSWISSGAIVTRQDVRKGFDALPEIFNALFDGSNSGTLLAEIHPDAWATA